MPKQLAGILQNVQFVILKLLADTAYTPIDKLSNRQLEIDENRFDTPIVTCVFSSTMAAPLVGATLAFWKQRSLNVTAACVFTTKIFEVELLAWIIVPVPGELSPDPAPRIIIPVPMLTSPQMHVPDGKSIILAPEFMADCTAIVSLVTPSTFAPYDKTFTTYAKEDCDWAEAFALCSAMTPPTANGRALRNFRLSTNYSRVVVHSTIAHMHAKRNRADFQRQHLVRLRQLGLPRTTGKRIISVYHTRSAPVARSVGSAHFKCAATPGKQESASASSSISNSRSLITSLSCSEANRYADNSRSRY